MTTKEIRNEARYKIEDEYKTQQETYNELLVEINNLPVEERVDDTTLAKIVSKIPPSSLREKYNGTNNVLIGFLIISIIIKIIAGFAFTAENGSQWFFVIFIFPLVNILLTWGVYKYQSGIHSFVGVWSIISIIRSLTSMIGDANGFAIFDILFAIVLIILGFYLQGKFTPGYDVQHEVIGEDSEGFPIYKNNITFREPVE